MHSNIYGEHFAIDIVIAIQALIVLYCMTSGKLRARSIRSMDAFFYISQKKICFADG